MESKGNDTATAFLFSISPCLRNWSPDHGTSQTLAYSPRAGQPPIPEAIRDGFWVAVWVGTQTFLVAVFAHVPKSLGCYGPRPSENVQ